jgi:hypothetical protein
MRPVDFLLDGDICVHSLFSDSLAMLSLQAISSFPQQAQSRLSVIMNKSHRIQFFELLMYDLLPKPNFSHNLLQTIMTIILFVLIGVPQILLLSGLMKN